MFEPTTYEIVIRGRANARMLHPLLDDFDCDHTTHGVTRLIGEIHDPAHLHGLVAHLTGMNAELISIAPAEPPPPPGVPPTSLTTDHQQEWTTKS
jgi:hypothetical protein